MLIGYIRPYEEDQQGEQQLQLLQSLSCDRYLVEEHRSAKKRVALDEAIQQLQANDVLIVQKLFVLADSTKHLAELLYELQHRQAYFVSLQERLDTRKPDGQLFQQHVQILLAFQSDMISENTKKGMYEAKQKGNQAGRPRKLDENIKRAIQMYESKQYSLAQIREQTGISKTTLYRYLEN